MLSSPSFYLSAIGNSHIVQLQRIHQVHCTGSPASSIWHLTSGADDNVQLTTGDESEVDRGDASLKRTARPA